MLKNSGQFSFNVQCKYKTWKTNSFQVRNTYSYLRVHWYPWGATPQMSSMECLQYLISLYCFNSKLWRCFCTLFLLDTLAKIFLLFSLDTNCGHFSIRTMAVWFRVWNVRFSTVAKDTATANVLSVALSKSCLEIQKSVKNCNFFSYTIKWTLSKSL